MFAQNWAVVPVSQNICTFLFEFHPAEGGGPIVVLLQVRGDPGAVVGFAWDGQHRGGECEFLVVRAALGGVVLDDLHGDGVVAVGVDAGHGDAGVGLDELEHGEE